MSMRKDLDENADMARGNAFACIAYEDDDDDDGESDAEIGVEIGRDKSELASEATHHPAGPPVDEDERHEHDDEATEASSRVMMLGPGTRESSMRTSYSAEELLAFKTKCTEMPAALERIDLQVVRADWRQNAKSRRSPGARNGSPRGSNRLRRIVRGGPANEGDDKIPSPTAASCSRAEKPHAWAATSSPRVAPSRPRERLRSGSMGAWSAGTESLPSLDGLVLEDLALSGDFAAWGVGGESSPFGWASEKSPLPSRQLPVDPSISTASISSSPGNRWDMSLREGAEPAAESAWESVETQQPLPQARDRPQLDAPVSPTMGPLGHGAVPTPCRCNDCLGSPDQVAVAELPPTAVPSPQTTPRLGSLNYAMPQGAGQPQFDGGHQQRFGPPQMASSPEPYRMAKAMPQYNNWYQAEARHSIGSSPGPSSPMGCYGANGDGFPAGQGFAMGGPQPPYQAHLHAQQVAAYHHQIYVQQQMHMAAAYPQQAMAQRPPPPTYAYYGSMQAASLPMHPQHFGSGYAMAPGSPPPASASPPLMQHGRTPPLM